MKRPYKFTHTARLITIIYGAYFVLLVAYLSASCDCSLKAMFQVNGLFWMGFVLFGLLLLLGILKTAERGG